MTVLFADRVGSTAQAERLDPEDVRGLLSLYFARVRSEIEHYGGMVEKFIGDAVVALFGAPAAHEDDPERAVRAALGIREAIVELNADRRGRLARADCREHGRGRGRARRESRRGRRRGHRRHGQHRRAGCSRPRRSTGSWSARRRTAPPRGVIEYREAESVRAKGKVRPIQVWEALEPSSRAGSTNAGDRDAVRRPRRELAQLLDGLVRAAESGLRSSSRWSASPGIGKTRLARELWPRSSRAGVRRMAERPLPALRRRRLVRGAGRDRRKLEAGILANDPAEEATAKLRARGRVAARRESTRRGSRRTCAPLVGLGADPVERREESFAAWRRFFEALAERHPLVLVFEDLHWADDGLLDFVD